MDIHANQRQNVKSKSTRPKRTHATTRARINTDMHTPDVIRVPLESAFFLPLLKGSATWHFSLPNTTSSIQSSAERLSHFTHPPYTQEGLRNLTHYSADLCGDAPHLLQCDWWSLWAPSWGCWLVTWGRRGARTRAACRGFRPRLGSSSAFRPRAPPSVESVKLRTRCSACSTVSSTSHSELNTATIQPRNGNK